MASVLPASGRGRALQALKDAERFLKENGLEVTDEAKDLLDALRREGRRVEQASRAFVLALLTDQYTPVSLFAPWASVRRFREWRDDPAVKMDVIVRHGRCCVRPSSFFAHWNSLPTESKRAAKASPSDSAGQSAGGTPSHPGGRGVRNVRPAGAGRG